MRDILYLSFMRTQSNQSNQSSHIRNENENER